MLGNIEELGLTIWFHQGLGQLFVDYAAEGRSSKAGFLLLLGCRSVARTGLRGSLSIRRDPAGLVDNVPISPLLPVELGPITIEELRAAAKSLKSGKVSGPDGTPIEFWKAVLNCGSSEGSKYLREFCSEIWS